MDSARTDNQGHVLKRDVLAARAAYDLDVA